MTPPELDELFHLLDHGSVLGSAPPPVATGAAWSVSRPPSSPAAETPAQLLARPMHLPSLGPGGRCPVSAGSEVSTNSFRGPTLGHGPVRVLLADRGAIARGDVELFPSGARGWYGLQTLWYALPGYRGAFVVRRHRSAPTVRSRFARASMARLPALGRSSSLRDRRPIPSLGIARSPAVRGSRARAATPGRWTGRGSVRSSW
jgi:hypothetical protein